MGIKKQINQRLKGFLLTTLLFICFFSVVSQTTGDVEIDVEPSMSIPKSSAEVLVDKVYAFDYPSDMLEFQLNLIRRYDYWIFIETVTPNNVLDMNVSIWDPEGANFHAFSRTFYTGYQTTDYMEFPFGAAVEGIHTIRFNSECSKLVNVHIRIEKSLKCLYDKIDQVYIDNFIYYDVHRFSNEGHMEFSIPLKTDRMYRIFMGRVSPLAYYKEWDTSVDYEIRYPDNGPYLIMESTSLPRVVDFFWTFFGTADQDTYTVKFTIYCDLADLPYVNIAFAISDDYQITNIIDENGTTPDDSSSSQSGLYSNATSLPPVALTGTTLGIIGLIAFVAIYVHKKDKKNPVRLDPTRE